MGRLFSFMKLDVVSDGQYLALQIDDLTGYVLRTAYGSHVQASIPSLCKWIDSRNQNNNTKFAIGEAILSGDFKKAISLMGPNASKTFLAQAAIDAQDAKAKAQMWEPEPPRTLDPADLPVPLEFKPREFVVKWISSYDREHKNEFDNAIVGRAYYDQLKGRKDTRQVTLTHRGIVLATWTNEAYPPIQGTLIQ